MNNYLPRDQEQREAIVNSEKSAVVYASAGAGKTTLLVKKMSRDAALEHGHYKYVAMTFTNKAVEQINSKMISKDPKIIVNTIDGFFENEIVNNFIRHVYPGLPNFNYSYKPEYVINSYEEGIQQIRDKNIFGEFTSNMATQGRNFKYEVALQILQKSLCAREFLKAKYKKFYLDEYQDSDKSMHKAFMYIMNNLGINMLIVGDDKQSIYQWRGGFPENFRELKKLPDIEEYTLTENFRSVNEIVDLSNSFSEHLTEEFNTENNVLFYLNDDDKNDRATIIQNLINNRILDLEKSILILSKSNKNIQALQRELEEIYPKKFKYIPRNEMKDCTNALLMEQIAKYYFNQEYNENMVLDGLRLNQSREFKRELKKNLDILRDKCSEGSIENVFRLLNVPVDSVGGIFETEILLKILSDSNNRDAYTDLESDKNYIMTVFTAKGLEFDQVVIDAECCLDKYPDSLKFENNYVSITRAKSKLVIIDKFGKYKQLSEEKINENNDIMFDDIFNLISI